MTWFGRLMLALSLAADAFAAALCVGVETRECPGPTAWKAGLLFGGFQGLMPALGYWFSGFFKSALRPFCGAISFLLLGFLGGKMIWESVREKNTDLPGSGLLALAVATSIDAWTAGIPLALHNEPLWMHLVTIVSVTLILSVIGVYLGARIGASHRRAAGITGGVILILLGIRFLLEMLFPGVF